MPGHMRNNQGGNQFMMCEECSGLGHVMVGPDCPYPASMCCGGCYTKVECEKCNGKGYEIKEDNEDEDGE